MIFCYYQTLTIVSSFSFLFAGGARRFASFFRFVFTLPSAKHFELVLVQSTSFEHTQYFRSTHFSIYKVFEFYFNNSHFLALVYYTVRHVHIIHLSGSNCFFLLNTSLIITICIFGFNSYIFYDKGNTAIWNDYKNICYYRQYGVPHFI